MVSNILMINIGYFSSDFWKVWSNGRFKKVRGIPRQNSASGNCNNSQGISISLLVTLPMESTLSPLSSLASNCSGNSNTDDNATDVDEGDEHEAGRERYHYRSFSFEEYAWRVYHDRFPFKDPLIRYKIWDFSGLRSSRAVIHAWFFISLLFFHLISLCHVPCNRMICLSFKFFIVMISSRFF